MWWARSVLPPGGPGAQGTGDAGTVVVHAIASHERPDRSVVDVTELPPGRALTQDRLARVAVRADTWQLVRSEPLAERLAAATPLVLVERVERDADPVVAELVAFAHADVAARAQALGAHVEPGAVVTQADAARLRLASAPQVGAVRWRAATGEIREIYVAPVHRRRGVATVLLLTAEGATAARGWPRLWAGGVRTALGDAAARRLRYGVGRVGALTRLAPPMTPAADRVGVPRRHLEPSD
ncbi:GNAT family N-acetyltransferase [Cellulomonas sp. Sa3CUA2]|uniref:GNAT family N-acetyltransferase n=1 Tax=Cellulomonas avistercoris TaxID=2762242 RepID=A0ABR8QH79_9CELL|nr:GNAT family N-acetyltransferase [Cellulomonas avistercoris]MBD7919781.1 GNAT family N-acetyltransferase [Cellulomonas avistercoris]